MMDTISKHQSSPIALARSEVKQTRRYYRREEKLRIVEESYAPGASVSLVARKHDVNANIVFAWRRQHKRGQLAPRVRKSDPSLLPILIESEAQAAEANRVPASSVGHIEIHLPDGRWLLIAGAVAAPTLRAVLAELTRS
jgi:transposase